MPVPTSWDAATVQKAVAALPFMVGDNLIVFTTNLRPGARLDISRFQPLTHLRKQAP
jgi:hypothetical protein